jgi:hypothetical protein
MQKKALSVLAVALCLMLDASVAVGQVHSQFGWRGSCRGGGNCSHATRPMGHYHPGQARTRTTTQVAPQGRERIYGSQMMTDQERSEYRSKMGSMKTNEEREAYREEHQRKMLERASLTVNTAPATQ